MRVVPAHDGLVQRLDAAGRRVHAWSDGRLAFRGWLPRIAVAAALAGVFFCCSYGSVWSGVEFLWPGYLAKIRNPLLDPTSLDLSPSELHITKLGLRLTVPLLAHALALARTGVIALYHVAAIAAFAAAALATFRATGDRVAALYAALLWAGINAGTMGFSLAPYFDPVAFALLAACFACRSPVVLAACLIPACYTDERVYIASGLVVFHMALPLAWERDAAARRRAAILVATAVGTILVCMAGRWALGTWMGLQTPDPGLRAHLNVTRVQAYYGPLAVALALEVGWIVPLLAVAALAGRGGWKWVVMLGLAAAAPLSVSVLIEDSSRAAAYGAFVLFPAIRILGALESRTLLRHALLVAAALSLVFPNHGIIGRIIWMIPPFPWRLATFVV